MRTHPWQLFLSTKISFTYKSVIKCKFFLRLFEKGFGPSGFRPIGIFQNRLIIVQLFVKQKQVRISSMKISFGFANIKKKSRVYSYTKSAVEFS